MYRDHSGVLLCNNAMFCDLKSVQSGWGGAPDPDEGAYRLQRSPIPHGKGRRILLLRISLHYRRTTYLEPPTGLQGVRPSVVSYLLPVEQLLQLAVQQLRSKMVQKYLDKLHPTIEVGHIYKGLLKHHQVAYC